MGECNCPGDLQKELQACRYGETSFPAVIVDAFAFHVLQRQVWLAVGVRSRIQQARDIRMMERIQNVALAGEPLAEQSVSPSSPRQFESHGPGQQAVGTLGNPDFGHAALADFFHQAPSADRDFRKTLKRLAGQ